MVLEKYGDLYGDLILTTFSNPALSNDRAFLFNKFNVAL